MIDKDALLTDLKAQVRTLEDDLRERSEEVAEFDSSLRKEWQSARDAKRMAATYESWLDGQVTQSAVAWVLGTVFLRFCEDNGLIDLPYLAGPGERLAIAKERQQAFFELPENREKTDREWITEGFTAMSSASPVVAGLYDRAHNPMWRITPSLDAAKGLIAFWRQRGDDGEIVHDFTDDTWNTRFLGDLYQDLSDHAKKTYALLQTPEFVEEFILDLTLEPAVDEFGLDPDPPNSPANLPNGLRLIDPTCGSGHFLLGAFHRLLAKWQQRAPGADRWDLINRALYSIHGVDKNPFAVAIARFRLLLAAMQAGEVKRLADTPGFALNIAVGDSLLHGRGAPGVQTDLLSDTEVFTYATEDIGDYKSVDLLAANTYHVVVGNPPYITVKDSQENENYRKAYKEVCAGKYALSAPFADRFFFLAVRAGGDRRGAGHVGAITANSFMKREFGKKLIEDFFAQRIDLTHAIDTSGAYIPGHGTPTVIFVGRNRMPGPQPTRAIMGKRGEPQQPEDPGNGLVWRAIVDQVHRPGTESEWISVADLPHEALHNHPWSLSGGGASDLIKQFEVVSKVQIRAFIKRIGFYGVMGTDEAMIAPLTTFKRNSVEGDFHERLVIGDEVRDWSISEGDHAFHPYDSDKNLISLSAVPGHWKRIWPYRTELGSRATFSKGTYFSDGRPWHEWHQLPKDHGTHEFSLSFAEVATHNHFVLDRGGKVFNRTAPVIKLPDGASEATHLALVGLLNSSTICFWLKQVCHCKGSTVDSKGARQTTVPWEDFYQFNGTKVGKLPLPPELPLEFGRELDKLAQGLAAVEPSVMATEGVPTRDWLDEAKAEHAGTRGRMISLQEELDWEVYRLYGLLSDQEAAELRAEANEVPVLKLGERAFEIVLARKVARGEIETQWFARHGSTPITEVPRHWPEAYRRVVGKRIETIEKRRDIALIERPECKRRWQSEPWEKKEKAALRNWLLDRCEDRDLWFAPDDMGNAQPRPMTVNRLADRLRGDADFVSVARLYAGADAELANVLTEIIDAEHVPCLAALRYKDTGMRKRAQWEHVWDLQREEDASGERLDIPVPPKYASADFRKTSYWRNRGKLDVPKERFISYPGASPDGDGSLLLGWAGWDHREQAHALMTLIEERTSRDGWHADRLTPLIAGLAEVLPWVRQWHGDVDPAFGMSPADAFGAYLEDQQRRHGLTADDLRAWRPAGSGRGRKPRAKKTTT
ncbi:MAG TPA: BREX-2 system adenine-specific DNA-methyltransferase PglX [Streptosporangiaceae bacterium]|nr:BREX-2 system adenine-specific DNA-methyltransferase PglX [Streptosporangiaceae bacterium]